MPERRDRVDPTGPSGTEPPRPAEPDHAAEPERAAEAERAVEPVRPVEAEHAVEPEHAVAADREPGDRIATNLLRLARDPATGRIRHRAIVAVGLRAALFAELALEGRIVNGAGSPAVAPDGPDEPTGDRMLDAVREAVEARPGVSWLRWYRHVSSDCTALRNELIANGRWTQQHGGWRATYADADADAVLVLANELDRVARYERAPVDTREAVLAALAVATGGNGRWPRPGAVRQELVALVDSMSGETAQQSETVQKVVKTAAAAMRRTRRGGSLSHEGVMRHGGLLRR